MILNQLLIKQIKADQTELKPTGPDDFFLYNNASFVIIKVLEELSQVEIFISVAIDKKAQETEIFNYFAAVSNKCYVYSLLENER